MSQPVPDGSTTFERYGIRGVEGENLMRQLAPLNGRYSSLGSTRYLDGHPVTDGEQLQMNLEMDILHGLLGGESTQIDEVPEVVTRAYRRTFDEWLALVADARPSVDRQVLTQQFIAAWHNVEELLKNNPR